LNTGLAELTGVGLEPRIRGYRAGGEPSMTSLFAALSVKKKVFIA
jgi:hypothetical protein